MACNCIKEFSYQISFDTCKRIIYQDTSTWVEVPEDYVITITTPTNQVVDVTVVTSGVTIITSITLGISDTEVNLPSGVYCIEVTNCNGDKIIKNFLNVCTYECELANLLALVDLTKCNDDLEKELKDYYLIKTLIDGAKAKFECDWCSIKEVKELLLYIKKKLSKLDCHCG